MDDVVAATQPWAERIIEWRHYLHQHPELSQREERTAAFVADRLGEFGLDEVRGGIAGHGIVAVLRGRGDGDASRTVLLRADMDALPVPDRCGAEFAADVVDEDYPGGPFPVSHACGHDAHTAMLLGALGVLAEHRDEFAGTVVAVFQPAEEGAPLGETGGAQAMLEAGALDGLQPTMAFGLHVGPAPAGTVLQHAGAQYAASTLVEVVVRGRQVHASMPWDGADPMPAVAAVITGSAQLYRRVPAQVPVTVSFGHISDHGRFNVIGDEVRMTGTMRAGSSEHMDQLKEAMRELVAGSCQAHGVEGEVNFLQDVPALENTAEWLAALRPSLVAVVGEDAIIEVPAGMGYDDMSEFVRAFGGAYLILGAQDFSDGGRGMVPNHNPGFYVEDSVLATGAALHTQVALDHLAGKIQAG